MDTIIIDGERERQGDYIFTAYKIGEYAFCFSNELSSFSDKLVDFDIMVESEPRPVAPAKPTSLTEQTSSLEESIYKLSGSLSSIQRTQKYFRTRDSRNRSTVSSTAWRISLFAIGESALMIGMSAFQVSFLGMMFRLFVALLRILTGLGRKDLLFPFRVSISSVNSVLHWVLTVPFVANETFESEFSHFYWSLLYDVYEFMLYKSLYASM